MARIDSSGYRELAPELHQHLYDIDMLVRRKRQVPIEQNPSIAITLTDDNFYEYDLRYVHQPPIERSRQLQQLLAGDDEQGPAVDDYAQISQIRTDIDQRSQIQTVYWGEQLEQYGPNNLRISVDSLSGLALRGYAASNPIIIDKQVDQLISDVFSLSVDNLYESVNRKPELQERLQVKSRIQKSSQNIFDYHRSNSYVDDQRHTVRYRSAAEAGPIDIALAKQPGYRYSQQQNQAAQKFQNIKLSLKSGDKVVQFNIEAAESTSDINFTTYKLTDINNLDPLIDQAPLDIYPELLKLASILEYLDAKTDHASFDTPDSLVEIEPLPHINLSDADEFIGRFVY